MPADTFSLAGKTAIVTGSGRENGIGAAIARALARNGAAVAIHYSSASSKERAEKVASDMRTEFGVDSTVIEGTVEDREIARGLVKQAMSGLNAEHIDILGARSPNYQTRSRVRVLTGLAVNNAATAKPVTLMDVGTAQLEHEFAVNVFGIIYMTQAVVEIGKMPQGGRIVNIGSIASKVLIPPAVYSTTKAATDALTTLLAGEASTHVAIFSICFETDDAA